MNNTPGTSIYIPSSNTKAIPSAATARKTNHCAGLIEAAAEEAFQQAMRELMQSVIAASPGAMPEWQEKVQQLVAQLQAVWAMTAQLVADDLAQSAQLPA